MALSPGILTSQLAPHRYRRQPQSAVEIDWGHPLARGLVFFQIPSMQAAHDLVSGNVPTVLGSATIDAGAYGRALSSGSTSTDGWSTQYRSDLVRTITTDFTLATKVDISAIAANSKLFCLPLNSNGWFAPYASIQFGRNASTSQAVLQIAPPTGTTVLKAFYAATTFNVENGASYVVTKSGTTSRMLYNKNYLSPSSSTLTTDNTLFGTGSEVALMNRVIASPGEGTAGKMYYAALWNRALSEDEARDFDNNPYQILKPQARTSTFAFQLNAFTGPAIGVLPKFTSLASGQRLAPGILGPSASTLPKFTSTTSATRTVPAKTATVLGVLPKFGALAEATRTIPPRTATAIGVTPKFTSAISAIALGPGFSSASASTLPKFSGLASAVRTLPLRSAASAATLPKFTTTATGSRVVQPVTATAIGLLAKFGSSGIALRSSIDRNATAASSLRPLGSLASATRTVPPTAVLSAATLPRFAALATAARSIPARIAAASAGLPRLRATVTAVSLPPAGTVVPVTVNHRRAPSWRSADAGTGASNAKLSFASPLDPNGLTYVTIDWSTELSGSTDSIILNKDAIGVTLTPSSVVAGLMIHAITFDDTTITVWLKIQSDQQNATHWTTGETYDMNFLIKTMNGQIFNRTVAVSIKQL